MARDWLSTLRPASYKATPFKVEHDDEEGGRRIVVHQRPMNDVPYLEDLGEDKRGFEVIAYLASDTADSDAASLVATCASRGAGTLVLPAHDPLNVRCLNFRRSRDKDKAGYIAFQLNFIREGAASALASSAMLANAVYVAADAIAPVVASSFAAALQVTLQTDFVIAAASDGAQDAASTLEAIRTSEPVDPTVSAAQRNEIQSIFDAAPDAIVSAAGAADLASRIVTSARALGDGMPASSAVTAFDAVVSDGSLNLPVPAITATTSSGVVVQAYPTPSRLAAAQNDAAARRLTLLAALTAYCEAITQVTLSDRPAAITLRANVAEYVEGILLNIPPGEIDLYHAIAGLRDAVVEYLSRAIIDLAPVVTVSANLSLPSLYWAWRLYADPTRSADLVARNLVPHPSFMPATFEALAK